MPRSRYMWASVQTVRGCPKHCSFCSVWRTDGQRRGSGRRMWSWKKLSSCVVSDFASSRWPTTISIRSLSTDLDLARAAEEPGPADRAAKPAGGAIRTDGAPGQAA